MTIKLALATTIAAFVMAAPALAETYYVIQDKKTMKCTVVKEKPKETTLIGINILGLEFGTQVEADEAVKTTKVCVKE